MLFAVIVIFAFHINKRKIREITGSLTRAAKAYHAMYDVSLTLYTIMAGIGYPYHTY